MLSGKADCQKQNLKIGCCKKKSKARDKKIAEYLRSIGVSAEGVETALAIK